MGSIQRRAGRPLNDSQASTRTSTRWPRAASSSRIARAACWIRSGSPLITRIWFGVYRASASAVQVRPLVGSDTTKVTDPLRSTNNTFHPNR